MANDVRLAAVEQVRITMSYASSPRVAPHDVFVLEGRIPDTARPFDAERHVDAILAAVRRSETAPLVVRVGHTHRLGPAPSSEAEIEILLTTGGTLDDTDRDAASAVLRSLLSALRGPDDPLDGPLDGATLGHDDALTVARTRVARAFPEVTGTSLRVTDEEHLHGVWSLGLADSYLDRYEVTIGVVADDPATTHIRRLPASEVVDSVGSA